MICKKKILIISSQRPYYGGASTTAYNLTKLLAEKHIVKTIFFFRNEIENIDPDKIGLTHGISIFDSKRVKKVYHFFNFFFKKKNIDFIYFSMRYQIYLLLKKNKYSPDLIIINIPVYFKNIARIFKNKRIVFIVNGHSNLDVFWSETICANVLNKEITNTTEKKIDLFPDNFNGKVIFNSQVTQEIYKKLGHYVGDSSSCFFNILKDSNQPLKKFEERSYDIAFIVSMFNRKVKNIELAHEIFKKFPKAKKIAIGEGSELFGDCPHTTTLPLMHQQEVYKILSNVKVVLLTSFYDSSPGLQAEAILMGANVISSKNIGWHEMLSEQSVVNSYFDKEEWFSKTEFLIENFEPNTKFRQMISNSRQQIINVFSDEVELI